MTIFQTHPDVLAQYQRWFRYILVDEYQDTNVAQYLWLRLLAQAHQQHLLRGRRRPVDLRLARRRGGQHPAVREGFSRREGDPAGAELPLHRRISLPPPRGVIAANAGPAGQDAVDRGERGREGPPDRPLGRRGRGALDRRGDRGDAARHARHATRCGLNRHGDPGPRQPPDARLRGPVPDHRPALPGDRRAALLRAARDPRRDGLFPPGRVARRRSGLRAGGEPPKRGLGDKAQADIQRHGAGERGVASGRRADAAGRGRHRRQGRRRSCGPLSTGIDRWHAADAAPGVRPISNWPRRSWTNPATPTMWQNDKTPEAPGRLENLKELVKALEQFDNLQGFLEHVALIMDNETEERGGEGHDHDPARRQGAGVSGGLPARLGGRAVPQPAQHGRERA